MTKRRRTSGGRRAAEARFWYGRGDDHGAAAPEGESTPAERAGGAAVAPRSIRPTPDPGALVRSLGPAPLALDHGVVERHLTAVYEEAVRTATALAAANGLLDTDPDA